jgi:translation initiation factor 2 beta subunit (eIF-2beta)/eIF-5
MGDIVDFNSKRQQQLKEEAKLNTDKARVRKLVVKATMETAIRNFKEAGYDIKRDSDIYYDMLIIHNLLSATLSRKDGENHVYQFVLDALSEKDIK